MTDAIAVFQRDDLFKRLSNRPKARTLFVFGQSLLDEGSQAMLITSVSHASGIPHAGEDQGEGLLVAEIKSASEQLASS